MISFQAPGRRGKVWAGVSGVDLGPGTDLPIGSFSASPVEHCVYTADFTPCFSFLSVTLANGKLQRKNLPFFFL